MALKTALKTHILQKLIDDFAVDSNNSNFLFIARPESWSDDNSPPTYVDNTESFNDLYNRMIAAKRITDIDAYLMIPKNPWTSGATYGMYTDDDDMSGITFWITNSENNVYKCLFNGISGGNTTGTIESTNSPRGTSSNTITTSDGYKWKFMFKVPENWGRFITDGYIPVKKLKVEDGVSQKFDDERQLQYSVQYNAVNGAINYIDITGSGSSYPNNVPSRISGLQEQRTFVSIAANTGTTGYAVLNDNESSTDNTYNTYSLNIVQGLGVGQQKTISDYDSGTKTATISSNWSIIPDSTSLYEIMPEVTIDGDGVNAEAKAIIWTGNTSDAIKGVEVTNKGSGYTRAYVTVKTTNDGNTATFDPMLSPYGGHGSNPISEIPPTRLLALIRLDREEGGITSGKIETGSFPLRNDFRQYGLLRNPILATGPRAGKVAGIEVDTVTDINISAATGSVFGAGDFVVDDIVFGETSTSCGKVLQWYRNSDISKGTLRLLNVNSNFSVGESVIGLGTGGNWSSSGKGSGYVQFQDETTVTQTNSHYRMTTLLEVESTGGNDGHTYVAADFDLDQIIEGASGSSASIVEYIPSGGQTAAIFLTTIVGSSGADAHGFTVGENLSGVTISSAINKVDPPEFVKGSGEVLYINNVAPITRHNEQEEEIKIIIDI